MVSLDEFGLKLCQLAKQVDEPHVIVVSQGPAKSISLAEIALHSRDASGKEFHSPMAVAAREKLLVQAQEVERQLRAMVDLYLYTVQPQMEQATQLCHETPCGGATWELDWSKLQQLQAKTPPTQNGNDNTVKSTSGGNQTAVLQGEHGTLDGTPCGRLQVKSMEFLETTRQTKPQLVMASRAQILLSLAMEFNAPLQEIRKNGTFEEEYQALTNIRQGLSLSK